MAADLRKMPNRAWTILETPVVNFDVSDFAETSPPDTRCVFSTSSETHHLFNTYTKSQLLYHGLRIAEDGMVHTSEDEDHVIGNAQFRSLIDGANDGLFLIDPETGHIDGANETVCDWLGYSKDEVLDMTIFDCQTTFSEPGEWQTFVTKVRDENGVRLENEIMTRTGSMVPVEGSISVVPVDGSEYVVAIPRRIPPRE